MLHLSIYIDRYNNSIEHALLQMRVYKNQMVQKIGGLREDKLINLGFKVIYTLLLLLLLFSPLQHALKLQRRLDQNQL